MNSTLMNKNARKKILAAFLTATVGLIPLAGFGTVEAAGIGLGNIGKSVDKVTKSDKSAKSDKTAKSNKSVGGALGGALGLGGDADYGDLSGRQKQLLSNLTYSTALLAMATSEMNNALGLGLSLQGATSIENTAKAAKNSGNIDSMLNSCNLTTSAFSDKNAVKNTEKSAVAAINGMDDAKREELKSIMRRIKTERLVADGFVAASALDAAKIVKGASSGLKNDPNKEFQRLIDTTKQAQSILKVRNSISGMLKNTLKAYEKTTPLGEPDASMRKKTEVILD